ncbi:unnamed protein product [Protopolystoma xenopodis]|uniref:PDZ domain-containing protein n=1 Tax=Protopolystoma xenopodis TaxID=117903 RepID=A0A448XDQ3_9PLAT|nr:unnamed protein product [Protopolystoma xenopodis]
MPWHLIVGLIVSDTEYERSSRRFSTLIRRPKKSSSTVGSLGRSSTFASSRGSHQLPPSTNSSINLQNSYNRQSGLVEPIRNGYATLPPPSFKGSSPRDTSVYDSRPKSSSLGIFSGRPPKKKSRVIFLIDSLVSGGPADQDGRISVGDRLLRVNDRKLEKVSFVEAIAELNTSPCGVPCLLVLGKMKLHTNRRIVDQAMSLQVPQLSFLLLLLFLL